MYDLEIEVETTQGAQVKDSKQTRYYLSSDCKKYETLSGKTLSIPFPENGLVYVDVLEPVTAEVGSKIKCRFYFDDNVIETGYVWNAGIFPFRINGMIHQFDGRHNAIKD